MSEAGVISVVMAALAGLIWAVRVEGMVRAHEKEIAQLRIDTKGEISELKEDVRYIRKRIDEAIAK